MEDYGDLTEEQQVDLLKQAPDGGQTDNAPPADVEQPPQDGDWDPNTDPNIDTVDPARL